MADAATSETIVDIINYSESRKDAAAQLGIDLRLLHYWIIRLREQGWEIPSRARGGQHFPPKPWWAESPPPRRRRRRP